jgi:hypothetical protein
MFLLRLSTLLFLYIPQFSARFREYVGERVRILLSPSYSFSFFFFLFHFLFSFFFYFSHRWGLFVILSKYIHMRSCFEGFIKRNPMM